MGRGFYWQPVLSEFTKRFPNTRVYTGNWPGFITGFEEKFNVEVVGETKFVKTTPTTMGYSRGFSYVSPKIVVYLLQFKPQVIFAVAFSLWTLLALLLKPLGRWRVVIIYNGSSPNIDYRDSPLRLFYRRLMSQLADAFITNSQAGNNYLTEVLGVKEDCVFTKYYEVPTSQALSGISEDDNLDVSQFKRPIFLCVGVLHPRKGLHFLLEACNHLRINGYHNYTLVVAGDGPQKDELKLFVEKNHLEEYVHWAGWVEYSQLGTYFRCADVFVFPTLEDIWGMVLLEAMACGKPILCSKWAGAKEMVTEGENGYIFDPYSPEELATLMRRFIDQPDLILSMGQKSQEIIAPHTPEAAAKFLEEVTSFVLK